MIKRELRYNAYYYTFKPTGLAEVDAILSAVAWAGKYHHHTKDWTDDWEGPSEADRIQLAADEAAARLRPQPVVLRDGVHRLQGCTVCLTDKGNIVVLGALHHLGDPEADDHPHSCNAMGCSSFGPHVLAHGPVTGDAWPDSRVQTLLNLLAELLCRIGSGVTYYAPAEVYGSSWHHEAAALVQAVLCQAAEWSYVEARLAELREAEGASR